MISKEIMTPSEREQLKEDIREFRNLDNNSCFCSATSNPPCSNCTHPGNVGPAELEEVEMIEQLEDVKFLPGDKVIKKDDVEAFATGRALADINEIIHTVDVVGINSKKEEVVKLVNYRGMAENSFYRKDKVVALEDVRSEMINWLADRIKQVSLIKIG